MSNSAAWDTLLNALCIARGRGAALTIARLAAAAGISHRECEHLLETRLEDLPFTVVAGSEGYWRPDSAEEINRYQASLQSRLRKLALRKRAVRRLAMREGFVRQGKTFADAPAMQAEFPFSLEPTP